MAKTTTANAAFANVLQDGWTASGAPALRLRAAQVFHGEREGVSVQGLRVHPCHEEWTNSAVLDYCLEHLRPKFRLTAKPKARGGELQGDWLHLVEGSDAQHLANLVLGCMRVD